MKRLLCAAAMAAMVLAWVGTQPVPITASVARGSSSGYRAADHNSYGVNNEYGMVNYSIEHTTSSGSGQGDEAHRRIREAGIGWIRYWLSWESVQRTNDPNPANWDWVAPDYDINAAIEQGLNVYVSILGAPAWPHGGVPTYHWLQCFAGNDTFDPTQPGCGPAGSANAYAPFDPAPLEGQSANWKRFVHAAVTRYGDRVKYWGFWNEPTEQHFWPEYGEGNCRDRLAQLVTKVIKPGREAALAANPSVQIVGPDDYRATSLEHVLNIERNGAGCGVPPAGRLFDVVAVHAYNIPSGGGELNLMLQALNQYDRREVWITETNAGFGLLNALDQFERRGWISKIFIGSMRNPGPCSTLNLLDAAKAPCPAYTTLQTHIAAHAPAMHFAGTTGIAGHNDFVLLMNPHGFATQASVHYSNAAGATVTKTYNLPRTSRTTLHVASEGHGGQEQGVTVVPAVPYLPIWAEHADYWNNNEAGRLSQGTGERSDKWYFAEGVVGGTYWVHDNTAYNPHPTKPVRATWQFLNASGSRAEVTHVLPPRGHHRVRVNTVPGIEGEHATLVSGTWASGDDVGLPAPIIAERTIAWGSDVEGHSTRGVPFPSLTWYFAEGSQGGQWATYLLLMNPHDRQATVQVNYMLESGLSAPYTYTVDPRRRFTIYPPVTGAFGILVTSIGATPVPIIAERAMYFGENWRIGHATEGATSPSQRWLFAEGSTEGDFFYDPYFLLANPAATDARVRLDFRFLNGDVFSDTVTVRAGGRRTVSPRAYPELRNRPFSTEIVVEASTPGTVPPGIVAERAMYWSGKDGWFSAHSTMGMP